MVVGRPALKRAYLTRMAKTDYFHMLLTVLQRPGMYGLHDAMDLEAFLLGYRFGGGDARMDNLLKRLTDYLKERAPEFKDSTCGWALIIKSMSWERGGSIELFRMQLALMLNEHGHWTDEHYEIFTSK